MDLNRAVVQTTLAVLLLAPAPSEAQSMKQLVSQLERGPASPQVQYKISRQLWQGDDTLSRTQARQLRSALIGGQRQDIDTSMAGSRISFQSQYDGTWKGIVTGKLTVNGRDHYEVLVEKPRKGTYHDVWSNSTELWRRYQVKPGQTSFFIAPGVRGTVLQVQSRTRLGTEFAHPMKVRITTAPPSRPTFEVWHIARDKVRTFKQHTRGQHRRGQHRRARVSKQPIRR